MSDNVEHVDFPFAAARRITSEEVTAAKLAVKEQFGIEPGETTGSSAETERLEVEAVSIRLNPQVLLWAKAEEERGGVGYQTMINEEVVKISVGGD